MTNPPDNFPPLKTFSGIAQHLRDLNPHGVPALSDAQRFACGAPDWATRVLTSQEQLKGPLPTGAVLTTRDGRRVGNAVMFDAEVTLQGNVLRYLVITDAGRELVLTPSELKELFHTPWLVCEVWDSPAGHAWLRRNA